ncbi:hypothetical protein LOD99_2420 [Oopsacas minuta]|uniref:Uncharacterized protein n=1 Tax=Oopsacas minuta TaxID=111878 RepID=A0AAV7K1W6_9METZ|nr:hypothetical protein LOD99_2420 [Oopsacas minuta]
MSKKSEDKVYENVDRNYIILPTGLEDRFSKNECIVPDTRAQVEKEKSIANPPTKSNTFSIFPKKSKHFKGGQQMNYNDNYNYNESLNSMPTTPIPSTQQNLSSDNNQPPKQNEEGYYIDLDELKPNIVSFPLSLTRIPFYVTSKKAQEAEPQPMEPEEDYIDMENSSTYCYEFSDIIIPPIRKTITNKAVHSHTHGILRKEFHSMIPKAPKRVESLKRRGQSCSGTRNEKAKNFSGYDFIPKFNVTADLINDRKNEIKTSEKCKIPPKDKRSNDEKILNTSDSMNRTSPQNIFYPVHEIIAPFANTTKKPTNTIPQIGEDFPRATSPIIQKQETIPNEQTNINSTPQRVQKQKSSPQPPAPKPKPMRREYPGVDVEEARKPTRLVKNQKDRTNSLRGPPPIKSRPKSLHKDDTCLPNEVIDDKIIDGERKEIKKLTQDLEKHLKQMNILDSIAPKSHFKKLNLYEDSPSKAVAIKNSTSPIESSNDYLRL